MTALAEIESKPAPRSRTRTVRIGLLGLGNVGQAFARSIAEHASTLHARGLLPQISAALVRDARRTRASLIAPPRLISNIDEFLAQEFDVVVELLGGVEPARSIVMRVLARGTPVVTANKSLLAHAGEELHALAASRRTSLRCEASVIAGVPFLGALRDRPLAARASRVIGVINGTSNFIVTRIDRDRATLTAALSRAIELGFAEPDARNDLSGRDAAEKLVVLLQHLGDGAPRVSQLETTGIENLHPDDLAQARTFGGGLRPIAFAERSSEGLAAFVGPAWLPSAHPLAAIEDECNALCLSRPGARDLVFSGPGAGPEVTAATVLDDVVDVLERGTATASLPRRANTRQVDSPRTGWFVRVSFAPRQAQLDAVEAALVRHGVRIRGLLGLRSDAEADRVYALTSPCSRESITTTLATLTSANTSESLVIRALVSETRN